MKFYLETKSMLWTVVNALDLEVKLCVIDKDKALR